MADQAAPAVLSVAEAIAIIDSIAVCPRVIDVPLRECVGLRLAQDVHADRDYPPFRKSQMDGYAVRCADVAGGSAELRVTGEIAAGGWPTAPLGPGEAMAIMTGAPLPIGADGVVPVEDASGWTPIGSVVRVLRASNPARFVAAQGSDCPAGAVVLRAGILIGPAQIAVAASVGAARLKCFARPRVVVLGTGDELVSFDQTPGRGQIRDSNTAMLLALLTRLGCEVISVSHIPDDPAQIRAAIQSGLAADALFIAGGMSMGQYDYVPKLLGELGVRLRITRLKIKPGKPFVVGWRGDGSVASSAIAFGLPGNPVSAYISTVRLAARVLARMAGGTPSERWIMGRLSHALPANGSREFYQPVVLGPLDVSSAVVSDDDIPLPIVSPLGWKGSADVFTLAGANALLVRAEDEPAIPAGSIVRVLELP